MKGFRRRKALSIGILILILAAASFLRFHRLGDRPLYGDESYHTVLPATLPLPVILSVNHGSILYPAILHFLLPLGQLEFMARLPSAVFGIFSVWVLYAIGRLVFRRKREALMAAVFGATSGILIYFSQQARGYSGMLLFSLLALYFFLRAVKDNRPILWAGYAVSLAVGIYMHFFMLIVIPVHALYAGIPATASWRKTRRLRWDHPAVRLAAGYAAASGAALIAAYLLYLPTQNPEIPGVDFFHSIRIAAEGLLERRTELAFLPYVKAVIFRLLDHQAWPLLFHVKIFLAVVGLAACLKNKTREGILFFLYITLPFVLFVYSDPPAIFQTIQHNKFIFVAPVFFLLMARGFGAVDSMIAGRRFAVPRESAFPSGRNVLRVVFIAAILCGELLCVLEFRHTIWETRTFPRNARIVDHMKDRIGGEEAVLSDGPLNALAFVFAKPIVMPRTGRPHIAFLEVGDFYFQWSHTVPMGLWMVLTDTPFDDDDARRLKSLSGHIEILRLPPHTLISYPDRDRPLVRKVGQLMEFFKTLPIGKEKRLETDLFLASTYLIVGKNKEALEILDARGGDAPGGWAPTVPERKTFLRKLGYPRLDIRREISDFQSGEIDKYLLHNAAAAAGRGHLEEALALLGRIRPLDGQTPAFQSSAHTVRGDVFRLKGMNEAAEKEYFKALVSPESPLEEADLIGKISRLRNMPSGFMISQAGRTCRVRWWSEERRSFAGRIGVSEKIRRVRGFRLTRADSHLREGRDIGFRGVSQKGGVKGLTIETRRPARIEMLLQIEGIRSLENHMIVIPDGDNPGGLTFK